MRKLIHILMSNISPAAALALSDQVMVSGVNFLQAILLLRIMGAESYGYFVLIWMAVLLASSLQQALILTPMMSLGPKTSASDQKPYYRSTWSLQCIFTLIVGLLALAVGKVGNHWITYLAGLPLSLVPALVAYLMQEYVRRYSFILGKVKTGLLLDAIAYPGMLLIIAFLGWQDLLSPATVFLAVSLSFGLSALLGIMKLGLRLAPLASVSQVAQRHGIFGGWLAGTSLLQFFSGNYFTLAAGLILGTAAVGLIRMVQNLMGVLNVLFLAMEHIVPMRAARAYDVEGLKGLRQYLLSVSIKGGFLVGSLLLLVALTGGTLLGFLYGEVYEVYGNLLSAFCLVYILIFPGYPLRYALRALEKTRPLFVAYVLSAGLSFFLAHPVVEAWGLMGVAFGLGITQIIMQMTYAFFLWREARINGRFSPIHFPKTQQS